MRLARLMRQGISVYEGISPALLATMSLSQGIKGSTNEQLINSLIKGSIIFNQNLQQAMKQIDRKHFTGNAANPYQNKPYKISGGQCMTDIFTHAVVLEKVTGHLESRLFNKNNWRILDIGCGHGYLAYVIAKYFEKVMNGVEHLQCSILGIDAIGEAIDSCRELRSRVFQEHQKITLDFRQKSLEETIEDINLQKEQPYDIVIGGFYMPATLESKLLSVIADRSNYFGIWASDSENGQSLYSHTFKQDKTLTKQQIMATLFSMPVVKSSVSKYFVDPDQGEEKEEEQVINEQEVRQRLFLQKKKRKEEQRQKLKQQLKKAITKHSKQLNKKLSLEEMKEIAQIGQILDKLK